MRYVIGVDGGGTKTMYALATQAGEVLRGYRNGSTNYYICGLPSVVMRLEDGVGRLLTDCCLRAEEIAYIHIALAGADTPADIQRLEAGLSPTMIGSIPHVIENDLWIAFYAQVTEPYGAISICGTGHNTGVLLKDGRRQCIQANRYPLGNFGGGRMLCDMALNAAFMSREHTGEKTELENRVAAACRCDSMDELAKQVRQSRYSYQYEFPLPRLVDDLALSGDGVARGILESLGRRQAEMTGRQLRYAGMADEALPVVLAGSVYCKTKCGALVDAFSEELRRYCPGAAPQLLQSEPVAGSVLCAIRQASGRTGPEELAAAAAAVQAGIAREGARFDD